MHGWTQRLYGALPAEEQQLHAWAPHDAAQNYATVDNMKADCHVPNQLQPQRVENSCLKTTLRLLFDLFVAAIALLFAVFGVWVYIFDGSPADPGSTGLKLFEASQYVSYLNPATSPTVAQHSLTCSVRKKGAYYLSRPICCYRRRQYQEHRLLAHPDQPWCHGRSGGAVSRKPDDDARLYHPNKAASS